jgi:hypothetical protein
MMTKTGALPGEIPQNLNNEPDKLLLMLSKIGRFSKDLSKVLCLL